jgi:hypothetical protein
MQALCYFCRKWFHVQCLRIVDLDAAKVIRTRKWDLQAPPQLLRRAMGTMRRGHPLTVAGEYGAVYQAQSILSAHMNGDSRRLKAWLVEKGHLDTGHYPGDDGDLYLCPTCNYVV